MTDKQIIIGTSGHVDHGKTTLLRCLTGIDADRWVEEKERGITIDIGFAHLEENGLSLSFIDVPGHKDFVTNMLSGIFSIDLAILIVAADESVMPQTKEHLKILSFLGINDIIPVITKTDLADEEMIEITELEIAELFKETGLSNPEKYFKVSSHTNNGINEFKQYVLEKSRDVKHDNDRPFYIPVDRSFSIKGHGTVVTGTLMSGDINVDEKIFIYPSEKTSTIKNITTHQNKVKSAVCKKRIALNLPALKKEDINRGQIIVKEKYDISTNFADAIISIDNSLDFFEDLKRIRVSIGTEDVIARVKLIEEKNYKTPFSTTCQLRFENPVPCFCGQKFIVRSYSPVHTIGGGKILLSKTHKRKGFKKTEPALLMLDSKDFSKQVEGIVNIKKVLTSKEIGNLLFIKDDIVKNSIFELINQNQIIKIEDKIVDFDYWVNICEKTMDFLKNFQQENPMKPGAPVSLFPENLLLPLNHFIKTEKFIKTGAIVKTPNFVQTLNKTQQENYKKLINSISDGGFSPPLIGSFEKEYGKNIGEYISLAMADKKIVRISSDLYFSRETFNNFINKFKLFAKDKNSFEVKEFKEIFPVSRKYIIPMLEFLDGEQLISRENETRKILKDNLLKYGEGN